MVTLWRHLAGLRAFVHLVCLNLLHRWTEYRQLRREQYVRLDALNHWSHLRER